MRKEDALSMAYSFGAAFVLGWLAVPIAEYGSSLHVAWLLPVLTFCAGGLLGPICKPKYNLGLWLSSIGSLPVIYLLLFFSRALRGEHSKQPSSEWLTPLGFSLILILGAFATAYVKPKWMAYAIPVVIAAGAFLVAQRISAY